MSRLYYVIGASGVGKDSIMNYAKRKLNSSHPIIFAHRYITRLPDDSSENHIYLTPREFKQREKNDLFSLYWESHGNFYAIGKEINYWMYQGFTVVINGSREYLPEALKKYKQLRPILIETSSEILLKRLESRGREDLAEIEKRMSRNNTINLPDSNVIRIVNDGPLEKAGLEFISIITGIGKATLVM